MRDIRGRHKKTAPQGGGAVLSRGGNFTGDRADGSSPGPRLASVPAWRAETEHFR